MTLLKNGASILICMLWLSCNYGSGVGEEKVTPKKFMNNVFVDSKQYSSDSLLVDQILKGYLKMHEQSFYNKEYFDSTELSIDTIMHSSDLNKIAIFAVVKTPMSRRDEQAQNKLYKFWYDAFCYIGIREQNSFKLKWIKRFYSVNWYDLREVSEAIRNDYFTQFSTIKDTSGAYQYKYNLNDNRFWTSQIWSEYFN